MLRDKVEKILEEKVRPLLRADGGDLEVTALDEENGELTVRLLGMCSRCPSAELTMESIVKNEVLSALPAIKTITLDTGISPELLDFAKKMLRHEVRS